MNDLDYYYDNNGNKVMTSAYLEKRGYCCQTKCRHCPYGFTGEPFVPDPPTDEIRASQSRHTPELEDY